MTDYANLSAITSSCRPGTGIEADAPSRGPSNHGGAHHYRSEPRDLGRNCRGIEHSLLPGADFFMDIFFGAVERDKNQAMAEK